MFWKSFPKWCRVQSLSLRGHRFLWQPLPAGRLREQGGCWEGLRFLEQGVRTGGDQRGMARRCFMCLGFPEVYIKGMGTHPKVGFFCSRTLQVSLISSCPGKRWLWFTRALYRDPMARHCHRPNILCYPLLQGISKHPYIYHHGKALQGFVFFMVSEHPGLFKFPMLSNFFPRNTVVQSEVSSPIFSRLERMWRRTWRTGPSSRKRNLPRTEHWWSSQLFQDLTALESQHQHL